MNGGIQDQDLTTPVHDEIADWANENFSNILLDIVKPEIVCRYRYRYHYDQKKADKILEYITQYMFLTKKITNNLYKRAFEKIKFIGNEVPLINGKDFIKGNADAIIEYRLPVIHVDLDNFAFDLPQLNPDNDDYISGILESMLVFSDYSMLFEFKSKVLSKGELLRQIQTYKVCTYENGKHIDNVCVICQEENAKSIVELNSFYFLKYDPKKYKKTSVSEHLLEKLTNEMSQNVTD
jgi:hypothetical protein